MDSGDAIDFDVADVGAELFSAKVVEIMDRVMVGFCGVISQPPFQGGVIWGAVFIDWGCGWRRWWWRDESAYAREQGLSGVGGISRRRDRKRGRVWDWESFFLVCVRARG